MYLVIKELADTAQDVIMVISSLTQDMNTMPAFKASAIRTLGAVVDSSMISGIERTIKQAIVDRSSAISSAALTTAIHFFHSPNRDAVKRWLPDVQAALQTEHGKSITQYHALGLLYLIKKNDRMALNKLFMQIQSQSTNMLATCLNLRIYSHLLAMDPSATLHGALLDLKPFLRLKGRSDLVALEAVRTICAHAHIYAGDVVFAITTLQMFLASNKALLRFAAIRALNDFASFARDHVAVCNVEIEGLVTDSNRNVATLAITTLLKTGNESSVDRLISQIMAYVSEISDEFKIIVVDAVRALGLKFPTKYKTMLQFLGSVLREDGGFEYKEVTVNAICELLADIPHAREPALAYLCEFIEDCEYPKLTAQILQLLGEEGVRSENPAKLIRYIYNRLILEDSVVRVAAVGALARLAASCPDLKTGILSILTRCLADEDDEVRDRAVISIGGLEDQQVMQDYFLPEEAYDLESLESQLMDYVQQCQAAGNYAPPDPFNIQAVPTVSKAELFCRSYVLQKSTHSAAPARPDQSKGYAGGNYGQVPPTASSPPPSTSSPPPRHTAPISQMPEFASFGSVFATSPHSALTEAESEYFVSARKHIFSSHLVVEFECRNTVHELSLENVQVQIEVQSEATFEPLFVLPISRLAFDEPQSCFVAYKFSPTEHPEATFNCSLRFVANEIDPSTGECVGRGSEDEYAIDSLELSLGDYVRPRSVTDFEGDWSRLPSEEVETFELPSMHSVSEAVKAVAAILGLPPHCSTGQAEHGATMHAMVLTGSLFDAFSEGGGDFSARLRFALAKSGVAVELSVRSYDPQMSSTIVSAFC